MDVERRTGEELDADESLLVVKGMGYFIFLLLSCQFWTCTMTIIMWLLQQMPLMD